MKVFIILSIVFIALSFASVVELMIFLFKHNNSKYAEVTKVLNTRLIILASLILTAVIFFTLYIAIK